MNVKELSQSQQKIYEYLLQHVTDDGSNLIDLLHEIDEYFSEVPESILNSYEAISSIDMLEIINRVTKQVIKKSV